MKKEWISFAGVLCVVGGLAVANGTDSRMGQPGYAQQKAEIDATHEADLKLCQALKDHARAVCDTEAKGKKKALLAKLDASHDGTPEASQEAKNVVAQAHYEVAQKKCDALKGKAEARCRKEAKAAREAARRQAQVEKVQSTGGIFGPRDKGTDS